MVNVLRERVFTGDAQALHRSMGPTSFVLPDDHLVLSAHGSRQRRVSSIDQGTVHNPRLGNATTVDGFSLGEIAHG